MIANLLLSRFLRFCLLLTIMMGILLVGSNPTEKPLRAADPKMPIFECRWTDSPITIDGKADEEAWKDAEVIDHFYLPWLGKDARKSRTATKARLLWDREFLYFTAEMEDHDLFADITEHDGKLWDNDVFELFFKPADNKEGYYEFQVNAAGAILDVFFPARGKGDFYKLKSAEDFHIEAKVKLDGTLNNFEDQDRGWTVEGKIPWKDFLKSGGRPIPDEKWKFALCRYDYSMEFDEPELSTCAPLSKRNFHLLEDYASLQFKGPPEKPRKPYGIEKRIPLTTSTVSGSPEPPLPYRPLRPYPDLKLNFPVAVAPIPGSDELLLITQDFTYGDTILRRMKDDPKVKETEQLWSPKGTAYSIAFHPKFAENGYVYMGWNGLGDKKEKHSRVTRFTMSPKAPFTFDLKSEKTIIEWPSDGHNGAAICFGLDGMFYVTSGDGTSDSDTNLRGQDLSYLTAKVLRLDLDHAEEGKTYSVPKDNPLVGKENTRPETWAYGLRNPWRMTVDQKTGHIWVGNNGQDLWEQIYFLRKGDNYGWSVFEGGHSFYPERKLGPTVHVKPALEHHHSEARSLTGGIVYYGKRLPELVGAYIYGDYSTGRIWAAKHDGEKVVWHKEIAQTRMQLTCFATDTHGELIFSDHRGNGEGTFYTLGEMPKEVAPSKFPKKLSESGLFKSVKGHEMQPALIPYSVNAPFWSDGAYKARWIALPGANPKIEMRNRGWGFPDQTVIVKSFALEMEEGKPESRKWIETRFMTKQGIDWFGYTYRWNDEQTDGILVESNGVDQDYRIKTAEGERVQKWHYPSRAECMVCHSRAANWVLGLCEVQLNKEHDYGGVRDHQFRVLEHLGVLSAFNVAEDTKKAMREELEAKGMSEADIKAYLEKQTANRDQRAPQMSPLFSLNPERYRALVDPYDTKQDLTLRAKSYLQSNCAACHIEAGGGNAQMELEFVTKLDKMRILDAKPVHSTFNLPEAKLIAPGHPERSVLLHRITHRKEGHMPPLSTFIPDQKGVELMESWIKGLR